MRSKRKKPIKVIRKKVSLYNRPYVSNTELKDWILEMYLVSLLRFAFLSRRKDRAIQVVNNLKAYVKEELNKDD